MPYWPKLTSLSHKACTLYTFSSVVYSLLPMDMFFLVSLSIKTKNPDVLRSLAAWARNTQYMLQYMHNK